MNAVKDAKLAGIERYNYSGSVFEKKDMPPEWEVLLNRLTSRVREAPPYVTDKAQQQQELLKIALVGVVNEIRLGDIWDALEQANEECGYHLPAASIAQALQLAIKRHQGYANPLDGDPFEPIANTTYGFEPSKGTLSAAITQIPPPRDFVLRGLLLAGKPAILGGFGGTFKTQFLLQAAVCIALGLPFIEIAATAAGAVVLVLGEEDQEEVERRVGAIVHAMQLSSEQVALLTQRLLVFPAAGEDIRLTHSVGGAVVASGLTETLVQCCIEHAARCGLPVRLIGLDHFMLLSGGELNSNEDATAYSRQTQRLAVATGAAVLTLAHSPKSSASKEEKDQHDVLGAAANVNNARLAALLVRMSPKQAKTYGVPPEQRHQYVELSAPKNNYGPTGSVCWMRQEYLPDYQAVVLNRVHLSTVAKVESIAAIEAQVLAEVQAYPGRYSKTAFAERYAKQFEVGRDRLRVVIDEMIDAGALRVRAPSVDEIATYSLPGRAKEVLGIGSGDAIPRAFVAPSKVSA
ncbi:MAG TPA: AAA family ATPase [Burkholderiales bacterium]|nr:AAA family ATPase [Burkholderiales bacterium]